MSDQSHPGAPGGSAGGTKGSEDVRRFDDVPADEEGEETAQGPDTRRFDDEPSDDEGT